MNKSVAVDATPGRTAFESMQLIEKTLMFNPQVKDIILSGIGDNDLGDRSTAQIISIINVITKRIKDFNFYINIYYVSPIGVNWGNM